MQEEFYFGYIKFKVNGFLYAISNKGQELKTEIQTSERTGVTYTQVTDEVMKTVTVDEATCSAEGEQKRQNRPMENIKEQNRKKLLEMPKNLGE